ncbi:MAG TPA: hypothetical protein VKA60_11910 [Blastocatellia bacterium]|nr:hypothetical protein [Blastocatellia bacterium]
MISRELKNYERLARVRDFGLTHAAAFPAGGRAAQLFAEIQAAVEELTSHTAAQTASQSTARAATATKAGSRAALHRHLEVINRTARGMSVTQPGIGEKFRMPLGSGDQVLLASARAFLTNATPLKQQFIDNELPADFLTQLAADIDEFEQALSDKH